MSEDSKQYFEFGEFRLDATERRLMRGETIISLTPKAFEMLRLLVENEGHLLGKDRLMEELWTKTYVDENNLADNVSKIRNALGDSRKKPKYIETVSGHGYRFIAKVVAVEAEKPQDSSTGSVEPEDESDPPTSETGSQISFFQSSVADYVSLRELPAEKAASSRSTYESTQRQPAPSVKKGRQQRQIFAAAGAFFLIVVVVFYVWNRDPVPTAGDVTLRSIAILPFKPITVNERDESLELGMSDTLITRLSSIGRISVRPISAVRRYTDLEQDAAAAGRELQVESVLEGNIQRAGERIRISARLVRVIDEKTLWTETFDEKFTDIFAVQDSISQKIAGALALHLSGDERERLTKKYTANTAAYQLYLKGRYFWNKVTPEGFDKSLEFYRQAIEMDPNYALAYAGLADSYNLLGSYGLRPIRETHPSARAAAEKALALDGELAEAHASLAAIIADYYWEWAEAEKHFMHAIALNPNYSVARNWYSQYLARMGRLEESIEEARWAERLDPLSSSSNAHLGLALYRARRYDESIAQLRKAMDLEPGALDAHIFLGFVYVQQGNNESAIAEFQTVVKLSERTPSLLALLGYAYAKAGKSIEARAILTELDALSDSPAFSPFGKAIVFIGLEQQDQAFEWLKKACDERAWQLGFLKTEPIFDPIRSDPRFASLLRCANLNSR